MHAKHNKHMFKIDPAKSLSATQVAQLCTSGTDAIIIGGTDGITYENTKALYDMARQYPTPVYQEISHVDAILPECDGYYIPLVLNAGDPQWLLQAHMEAIRRYGRMIPWEKTVVQGYIVLNPASKVAQLTKADTNLSTEQVIAYAQLADRLLRLPVVYMEYSGTYGDPALVRKVKRTLRHATLTYGGGIDAVKKAEEMRRFADTIVVGNYIYEDFEQALLTVALQQHRDVHLQK